MKKLLLICVFLFCCSSTAFAVNKTLVWDPNSETDLVGYRIYSSSASGDYTFGQGNEIVDIPAGTEDAIVTVQDGKIYFVLTAYDADSESLPSNEISWNTAPGAPGGFRWQ